MAIPDKRELRKKIDQHGGSVTAIAREEKVSRQTVYNWLDAKDLREYQTRAKRKMRGIANDVIYDRLMSDDEDKAFEAAKHVSLHLKDDGELMLSADVLEIMRRIGHTPSRAVEELEAYYRMLHELHEQEQANGS